MTTNQSARGWNSSRFSRPALFCIFLLAAIWVTASAQAQGAPFADAAYAPPSAAKSAPQPMPLADLEQCLMWREKLHVFRDFEGGNKALKALYPQVKGEPLKGGEIVEVDLSGAGLLGAPVAEVGGVTVYAASVISVDAEGVKLRFDVSGLQPGEEVWVIDPVTATPFGPYMCTTGESAETWAATVFGDETVVLVKTPYEDAPQLRVTAYSHLFLSFKEVLTRLSCHLDISCETDPATVAAASGVGILSYPVGDHFNFCSGTLINNAMTPAPEFEPFFTTANHCICSQDIVEKTEVIWDYRSDTCGAEGPDRNSLPLRSYGVKLLATDALLDATLIELGQVPVGPYGRIYLGWDSRQLVPGESVKAIHHPNASHMRISKGTVRAVNDDQNGRQDQTLVHWDLGVTEGGSSGSCLLLDNEAENNRIVGMLSQGPEHSCTNTTNNLDWFASFHHFFPQIQQYIEANPPSTDRGADDCRDVNNGGCPLSVTYAGAPAMLQGLRAVRDKLLAPTAAGSRAIRAYYKAAPGLTPVVAKSPAARGALIAATAPLARLGLFASLLPD